MTINDSIFDPCSSHLLLASILLPLVPCGDAKRHAAGRGVAGDFAHLHDRVRDRPAQLLGDSAHRIRTGAAGASKWGTAFKPGGCGCPRWSNTAIVYALFCFLI